jgi:hypothetical protein
MRAGSYRRKLQTQAGEVKLEGTDQAVMAPLICWSLVNSILRYLLLDSERWALVS